MDIVIKGLLIACLGLCVAFGFSRCQYKDLQMDHAEYREAIYKELVKVNQDARAREQALQLEVNTIGTQYEIREEQIRKTHAAELSNAIKSGTVKLRDHWQGCPTTSTVSSDSGTTRQPDAAEQRRAEDIGYLRELGALVDAKEKALQEYALMCSSKAKP